MLKKKTAKAEQSYTVRESTDRNEKKIFTWLRVFQLSRLASHLLLFQLGLRVSGEHMKVRIWGLGFCLLLGAQAFAKEQSYLPSAKHFRVFKDRSDCSVYSAVRSKVARRYRELSSASAAVHQIAKQRREALVLCGAPTKESRRALQEDVLADKCPLEYQEWLRSGEKALVNKLELSEAYRNLQSLAGVIAYHCGSMPELPDSLPPEPSEPSHSDASQASGELSVPAEKPD